MIPFNYLILSIGRRREKQKKNVFYFKILTIYKARSDARVVGWVGLLKCNEHVFCRLALTFKSAYSITE